MNTRYSFRIARATSSASGFVLLALLGSAGCKSRDFGKDGNDSSGVRAAFEPGRARGRKTIQYASPSGVRELCVLPKHFPGVKYPKDDGRDENALCGLDFYKSPAAAGGSTAVALCPKLSSTFPGVEAYELGGKDKGTYETSLCKSEERPTPRIAKFKQSVSCAYTGSILGYYHLSRILGEADNVPVAVVRTMDVKEHVKIAERGVAWSAPGDLNNQLWRQVLEIDRSPRTRPNYFTPDLSSLYGAISDNPAGEERYAEINRNFADGAKAKAIFLGTAEVMRVYQSGGVGAIVKRDFASAAQGIQQMKDLSDLVLMDHVFQQQDRFGNIHFQWYWMWPKAAGDVQKKRAKDGDAAPDPAAVKVKRLLLKDNDCGAREGNEKAFTLEDVRRLRHMSPKTYKRFQFLAESFRSGAASNFFESEALLATTDALGTDSALGGVKSRVVAAATVLKEQCKSGTLLLDLSLEEHLAGKNLPEVVRAHCDEVHTPEDDPVNADTAGGVTSEPPKAFPGKAIAKVDTWLKKSPEPSTSLPDSDKCALKTGLAIGYRVKSTEGAHTRLTVDIEPQGCPDKFFASGKTFVFTDHVHFIEPRECTVASETANVRTDSNAGATILGALPKGKTFAVEGRKEGWYRTWFEGKEGFVSNVTLSEPCRSAK